MRYAGIIKNDIANGPGVRVSFWTQGCPHRCPGCHNAETWDYNGGYEFTEQTMQDIIDAISANGIKRGFSILGGEPLCFKNLPLVDYVITRVKEVYPDISIYLWTGYSREEVDCLPTLSQIDVLIDGPFIAEERDITLPLCGSRNQRIWNLKEERLANNK